MYALLIAHWATVRARLFNVFAKKFFKWADSRGSAAASNTLDAYGQPGRNFSFALMAAF